MSHSPSSVTSGQRASRLALFVRPPLLPRPGGAGLPPPRAPARPEVRQNRVLSVRGAAQPASAPHVSATRDPACTPRRRTALPSRADPARQSAGRRRHPNQVLPPALQREETPLARHPNSLCGRTASACRTGHAFVTLPLTSHLPHESGRTQERHRVRLASPHILAGSKPNLDFAAYDGALA